MAKVLIDINDKDLEKIKKIVDFGMGTELDETVASGVVLSDDVANKEMIKAVFPQIIVTSEDRANIHFYVDDKDGHTMFTGCMPKYVWDAPYKEVK